MEFGALNSFQMVTFYGGQLDADRPVEHTGHDPPHLE